MRMIIRAVGKGKKSPEMDLFDQYCTRNNWNVTLQEVEVKSDLPVAKKQAKEASLLLADIKPHEYVIALDERGKDFTSPKLAKHVENLQNDSVSTVYWLIGGAAGHDPEVRKRANLLLSFGGLTWPHMMVRAMLAEQIYRLNTIINGHPYHKV